MSALVPSPHEMAASYHFDHGSFDGMDLLASYEALSTAVDKVRETKRPVFLEANCSRFRGHSMSDPGKYRTKESLEEEKARDPIPRLAAVLVERGFATTEQIETIDKDIKAELKEVLKNAESAPWPDESLIDRYVYASPVR